MRSHKVAGAILGASVAFCAPAAYARSVPAATEAALAAEAARSAVVTTHEGVFNGEKIRYSAFVESLDIPDANGAPAARIVSFSYVAEDARSPETRPVLFVFNGGPISASLWLHIGALGPKRIAIPDNLRADPATFQLIENSYSPLDAADLVFFDPASTGYSRALPGVDPKRYYSVEADGQQTAAFIAEWLKRHGREQSPFFLLGESYGTMRAAEAAAQLADRAAPLPSRGVFLMGQALNIIEFAQRPRNIVSYAVSLPTLAALAFHHGKIDTQGKTLKDAVEEAWDYGRSDYLTALFQGDAIAPAERDRVAARLEELTGVPAAYYRANMLRITKEEFRAALLKDEGLLLGRSDGRYTAPMTDDGHASDPSTIIRPAFERLFAQYVRDELNVGWPAEYKLMAEVAGLEDWDWGASTPFSDWAYVDRVTRAFEADPRFRVLIANGYHDTQTTVGAAIYAATLSGWPKERVSTSFYPGGHMAYTIDASAKAFCDDVRAFVRGEN